MKSINFARNLYLAGILLLQFTTLSPRSHGAAGGVDLAFDPGSGVNGPVNAVVLQPDGKVLIGGEFTTVKGLARPKIARLNADGSSDATFNPPADLGSNGGDVYAVALQADGKVLFAGSFQTPVNNLNLLTIRRLHANGSLDNGFNALAGIYGPKVNSMAIQADGKLLVGGDFESLGASLSSGIVRLNSNGNLDSTFNPGGGVQGDVSSVAWQPDGKVLIGGPFTGVNGTNRNGIARLNSNGSLDTGFDPGTEAIYRPASVTLQSDGKVLIGGYSGNGSFVGGMIRFDANGGLDSTYNPNIGAADSGINAVVVLSDGKVLAGGYFTAVNGTDRNGIARLNPNGSLDTGFNPGTGANGVVRSIAVQPDGKVLLGGDFTAIDGVARSRIVRLNADGSLDSGFLPGTGVDHSVASLVVQPDGKMLIGGDFTSVRDLARTRIARLHADGSGDATFNPGAGANGRVRSLAFHSDGKVLLAGEFDRVNGINRYQVARLNSDGTLDSGFIPGTGPEPYGSGYSCVLVQPDGKVLIGGYFNYILFIDELGGVWLSSRPRIIRLNTNGTFDNTFAFEDSGLGDGSISTMVLQPDGKVLVGGGFPSVSIANSGGIVRLNPNGSMDSSFNPGTGVNGDVLAIGLRPDGKLFIGGAFTTVNGTPRNRIARLNADGSLDGGFNPGTGANSWITSVVVQPDGKALIGGYFTTVNGTNRNRIARLNANGTLDSTFNPGTGPNAFASVSSIGMQPDGNILIGGDFTTINGVMRPYVARLLNEPLPPSFATWAGTHGLSAANAAAELDLDGDGLPNAVEYVLGGNPSLSSPTACPSASLNAGNLIFSFARHDVSETPDVTLTVEAGTDLLTWPTVFTIGATTATSSAGVNLTENGTAPDTISVAIPLGTGNAKFARLKVTVAP